MKMAHQSNQQQRTVGMDESLSALVDGEVSEMELHRILKASDSDEQMRATWSRYQVIGSVMRNDGPSAPLMDLSASIREAIDSEEAYTQPRRGSFWHNATKIGVAASVAAVMVLTTQLVNLGGNPSSLDVASAPSPAAGVQGQLPNAAVSLPAGFQAPSLSARTVSSHSRMPNQESAQRYYPMVTKSQSSASVGQSPAPQVQAYLQRVMELHAGHSALNSGRGMLPYARVPVVEAQ